MKPGKTTLTEGRNEFPPAVELGADDRMVNIFAGPVWIRVRVLDPGESYDVIVETQGGVELLTDRPFWPQLIVSPHPDAIAEWQRGSYRPDPNSSPRRYDDTWNDLDSCAGVEFHLIAGEE